MDSLLHYVYDESPEAKAKAEERWKRNQAEAVRILAELEAWAESQGVASINELIGAFEC